MKSPTELKQGKSIGDMYDHSVISLLQEFGLRLHSIIEVPHERPSDIVRLITRNSFTTNKCLYFVDQTNEGNYVFAGNYDFQYITVLATPIN